MSSKYASERVIYRRTNSSQVFSECGSLPCTRPGPHSENAPFLRPYPVRVARLFEIRTGVLREGTVPVAPSSERFLLLYLLALITFLKYG